MYLQSLPSALPEQQQPASGGAESPPPPLCHCLLIAANEYSRAPVSHQLPRPTLSPQSDGKQRSSHSWDVIDAVACIKVQSEHGSCRENGIIEQLSRSWLNFQS